MLRVIRVLLPLLVVAAVVAAGASVLSARPDLDKAKNKVDASWTSLSDQLDRRYVLLTAVDASLRPIPGPIHALVADTDGALARWRDARTHSTVATQVEDANDLEAFARELAATAAASPRVRGNSTVLAALAAFLNDPARSGSGAVGFNADVTTYERQRRGPVRTIVASVLGDATIPVLDTTDTPTSASA
jgi:hypothetical protein